MMRSMHVRAAGLVLLLGVIPGTHAVAAGAVQCRILCVGSNECRLSSPAAATARSWSLDHCEDRDLRVEAGCAEVWYFSKRAPRPAKVCADQGESRVALVLKDPDITCSFLDCLVPGAPKAVAGASPIGPNDEGANSSGGKAGLPYGTILMPNAALRLRDRDAGADADGTLVIVDAGTGRESARVPIRGGTAEVDPAKLAQSGSYRYRWVAGARQLDGTFRTTTLAAWTIVLPTSSPPTDASAVERVKWRVVNQMALNGYWWNAAQAAVDLPDAAR